MYNHLDDLISYISYLPLQLLPFVMQYILNPRFGWRLKEGYEIFNPIWRKGRMFKLFDYIVILYEFLIEKIKVNLGLPLSH